MPDGDEVARGDPAEDLAAIGAGHGPELLERVLARGDWPNRGLPARVAAIRGTFALRQALRALRDGDGEELTDGLTDHR